MANGTAHRGCAFCHRNDSGALLGCNCAIKSAGPVDETDPNLKDDGEEPFVLSGNILHQIEQIVKSHTVFLSTENGVTMTLREYSTPKDALVNAALAYAERGWPVVPLLPRDKEPCYDLLPVVDGVPSWAPLREGASATEIRRWFDRDPTPNLGIITGGRLAVADVDYPDQLHGLAFPITPRSETSRGMHVYMDSQGQTIACGSYPWGEVKAEGGYVVAPPSVHKNGKFYEWYPFLSPCDVELAPPPDALLKTQTESGPRKNILTRSTFSEGLKEGTWVSLGKGACGEFACQWDVALGILTLCGAEVKGLKKAFLCPLPGHEERHPSASLWMPDDGGFWGMHDFHQSGRIWPLPDVYAACVTGKARELGTGERVTWWIRALEDIGAITVPTVPCPELPGDAKKSVHKLYAGFVRLLSIRAVYDPTQAQSTPFTWTFAQGWCGIGSKLTVQKALNWLFAHGYVVKCGYTQGKRIGLLELGDAKSIQKKGS